MTAAIWAPEHWLRARRRRFNRSQRILQRARLDELNPPDLRCRLFYDSVRDCHLFEYGGKKIRMHGEMPNLRVGEGENELTENQSQRLWELVGLTLQMDRERRSWWAR